MSKSVIRFSIFLIVLFGSALVAQAADTIEVYDVGATDFEWYAGLDGINLDKYEKVVYSELALGYGLLPALSGYAAMAMESDEYLTYGAGSFGFGLIGAPVDTDHFDLDLYLDTNLGGETFNEMAVTPGLEVNFDLLPDMGLWGVYGRVEEVLQGRDESTPDDPATTDVDETETKHELAPQTHYVAGTYVTLAERHQILMEWDSAINHNPVDNDERNVIGGLAAGYNVLLTDNLELVNQAYFDFPQNDEDFAWGLSVGLVVTLPAVKEKE